MKIPKYLFHGPGFKTIANAMKAYQIYSKVFGLAALVMHPRTGKWYVVPLDGKWGA